MNKVVRQSSGLPTVQGNMFAEIRSTNIGGKTRLSFSHPFVFRLLMLLTVLGLAKQGWSQVNLSNGSSSATIDFSNSTPASVGTNPASAFTGAGFSADPATAGRLNSNAWAAAGWSDGALAFGGSNTTGDYARGATSVAVTTGGFYAFTGSPQSVSNPCLMIQPSTGDFVPGTLTLRIKNTGTSPITKLDVSYNIYVRNDQGRGSSFNFSHSTDNSTYTSVAAMDYTTPQTADASGWVLVGSSPSRSTSITGLLVAPNSFIYIRWSSNDVNGSGSRDEIGLDDISLSATFCPTITFTGTPTDACPASSNGQIAVSGVTGGTSPFTYSKDNGASYQLGATFTGLAANTYQVVVKDANGCTSGATAVVVGTATPPACSISGADYVCNNSTGNVYTAPPGMASYSWGISSAGSIPGSTTGQSVSVTSGNYLSTYTVSVTITDGNGCTSSCSKVSDIFLLTPANITVNPNPACFGATLDLSIAAQSSSTVSWTGEGVTNSSGTFVPVAFNGYSFFNNQTTAVPTTTGPHIYGVTVTTDQGCSNTGTASVTVHPAPPACAITGPSSACTNATGNVYAVSGSWSAYSWGVSGSGSIVGSATGSSVSVTAGASGSYTVSVTVTDANGCTSTCSQPVTINGLPSATIIGPPPSPGPSNDTLCAGHTYVFTGPPGMSAYQWNVSSNATITGSATGSSVMITVNSNILAVLSMTVYLTVTDANGCTNTGILNKTLQPSPTCSLSGPLNVCGGSTGNVYTVTSNAQYYVWSISGNATITSPAIGYGINSVTVTAGASGTYTVTVDTKFSYQTCVTSCSQTVTVNSTPAPEITGPTSACTGGNVTLDAGAGYATYAWSNGGGSGQTATYNSLNASGTYTVTVTSASGCTGTDTHTVTVQSCLVEFSGKIIWEHDDVSGVNNATVKLTGSATGTDVSDINGDYLITTALTNGSFTLKPTKNINKLNGLSAGDATAIQQHVNLSVPITDPYKMVCADVNKSNSITTVDASLITQVLLGNPQANAIFNTSWRFTPTTPALNNPPWGFAEQRTYVNVAGPQINQDFFGMKLGDVTGDYANPANFGAGEPFVLRAKDQALQAGENLTVDFSADQLDDLAAFQFALTFDPALLQFEAIESTGGLPVTADHFGTYSAASGEIRAVWSQASGIRVEEATPAFRLRFKALQSGLQLSDVLQLDEAVLPARSYTGKLAESKVELRFSEATDTDDPAISALHLQVRPNPFRDATTVSFSLPAAGEAQLRVLDVNGRELLRINNTYPAGANSETLRLEGITASGVLTCELVTPFGVATRKMVLAR